MEDHIEIAKELMRYRLSHIHSAIERRTIRETAHELVRLLVEMQAATGEKYLLE